MKSAIKSSWTQSTVGAQFDIKLGKMIDAARNTGDPKKYLGNRSVQWGWIDVSAAGCVPMTRSDLQRYRLQYGDLLACEGRAIGRSAIWRDELPECYFQKSLHRLRAKSGYDARLMLAYLEYWASTGTFSSYVTQTSIPHLPRERFLEMPLPVPEPSEQQALGDIFDDIAREISALERLIFKKESIREGMIQQLLTGKTRLPGFKKAYSSKPLGNLGTFLKGQGIKREDVSSSGIPCIRYGELYTVFNDHTSTTRSFVKPEVAATAFQLRTGDLLFAGSGETREEIGKCVAYLGGTPAVAGGDLIVLRGDGFNPAYLAFLANTPAVANQKARAGQGDAVVHISSHALGQIIVDLPCREEQDAIAAVILDAGREIRLLRKRLDKVQAVKQGMMQQLLTGRTRLPV